MHTNWRDCDAWRQQSLPMNTTSNEAAKLYDVSLSQLVGFYENKQFNGLLPSLSRMVEADYTFVLGHCLKMGVEILGTNSCLSTSSNQTYKSVKALKGIVESTTNLTPRELLHVKAISSLARGDLNIAADHWEEILLESKE